MNKNNQIQSPEELLAEQILNRAKGTYSYSGPNFNLTEEQKTTFVPYTVETVNEVIMIMALAMKENNHTLLVEIHDKLMVSDLTLAYDILIIMLKLGDSNKMYEKFVPYTEQSQIDSKGIYRRCLGAIGFYDMQCYNLGKGKGDVFGYENPILGLEYVRDFGNGIGGIVITESTNFKENIQQNYELSFVSKYRTHIAIKYADLIEQLLKV